MVSFITVDNNYTIGTNYAEMDPGFKVPSGNNAKIIVFINNYQLHPTAATVDWQIASPLTLNINGYQALSWPQAFDFKLLKFRLANSRNRRLPLGNFNWFKDKKAEFLDNKNAIISALKDSIVIAKVVLAPSTMDETPLITEITTSANQMVPWEFDLIKSA